MHNGTCAKCTAPSWYTQWPTPTNDCYNYDTQIVCGKNYYKKWSFKCDSGWQQYCDNGTCAECEDRESFISQEKCNIALNWMNAWRYSWENKACILGTDPNCPYIVTSANPECGTAAGGKPLSSPPATLAEMCKIGTPSSVSTNSSSYTRACTNGTKTTNCYVDKQMNGDYYFEIRFNPQNVGATLGSICTLAIYPVNPNGDVMTNGISPGSLWFYQKTDWYGQSDAYFYYDGSAWIFDFDCSGTPEQIHFGGARNMCVEWDWSYTCTVWNKKYWIRECNQPDGTTPLGISNCDSSMPGWSGR